MLKIKNLRFIENNTIVDIICHNLKSNLIEYGDILPCLKIKCPILLLK